MTAPFRIAGREIGPDHPVYVIAEISANHGDDLERTKEMIRVAGACGADAVKLQTFTADTMTLDSELPHFQVGPGTLWSGRSLHDLYREAAMPWDWYPVLATTATEHGITLFSTPFDASAIDFLVGEGTPAIKIASFEIVDLPLIRRAAATGLPLIVSTGMATAAEIDDAVTAARQGGDGGVALLRCNSAYPSPIEDMALATIGDMIGRWGLPVGLSDHTLDHTAAIVAVSLGACIVEKHFTLRRSDGGPDAAFSLEPDQLADLVEAVRSARAAVGEVRYGPSPSEESSLAFRRSLHVVAPVARGQALESVHVRSIRPAGGLSPRHLDEVVGRVARRDLLPGEPLRWDDLEDSASGRN